MRKKINWREAELQSWIGTDERPLKPFSRNTQKQAFLTYAEFSRMTAKQLIDEAEAQER